MKKVEVDLEKFIQDKVYNYNIEKLDMMNVDKKILISMLLASKKEMEKEFAKSQELYEKAILRYTEISGKLIKSKKDKNKIKSPPERPKLPISYHKIDGYINLFDTIIGDKLMLKLTFLEKLFLETAKGLEEIESREREYSQCISGSACYFYADLEMEDEWAAASER
jgi:hypothetical protein